MTRTSRLLWLALAGGILLGAAAASIRRQSQSPDQSTPPVRSRAEETLGMWNHIGYKLIAMAEDFPEDKYDFNVQNVQKDERTFGQNLVHVAPVDYDLISWVAGSHVGPDVGKDRHNPPPDMYKTKPDVVKLLESAVADGAAVIKQQGDARLDKTQPFASRILTRDGWETNRHTDPTSYMWLSAIEHSAEHFGPLVVYYRADNLVPPESRR